MDENLFKAWRAVYSFQRARIENEYSGHEGIDDARDFLFGKVYTDPARRKAFEKRDAAFVRIARSRLFKLLTGKELCDYLEGVIRLKAETDRLDIAAASALLADGGPPPEQGIGPERYAAACRASMTKAERSARLEAVLRAYDLCYRIMYELPMNLDDILRYTPKIFMRNSDLLDLCVTAWRVFHRHKPQLKEYERIIRAAETAYIDNLFDGEKV